MFKHGWGLFKNRTKNQKRTNQQMGTLTTMISNLLLYKTKLGRSDQFYLNYHNKKFNVNKC